MTEFEVSYRSPLDGNRRSSEVYAIDPSKNKFLVADDGYFIWVDIRTCRLNNRQKTD